MNAQEIRQTRAEHGDIAFGARLGFYRFDTPAPVDGAWPVSIWSWAAQEWVSRREPVPSRDLHPHDYVFTTRDAREALTQIEHACQHRLKQSVAALLPEPDRPSDDVRTGGVVFYPHRYARFLGADPDVVPLVDGGDVTLTAKSFLSIAEQRYGVTVPEQVPVLQPPGFPDLMWTAGPDGLTEIEAEETRQARITMDLRALAHLTVQLRKRPIDGIDFRRRSISDEEVRREQAEHPDLYTEAAAAAWRETRDLPHRERQAAGEALVARLTGLPVPAAP